MQKVLWLTRTMMVLGITSLFLAGPGFAGLSSSATAEGEYDVRLTLGENFQSVIDAHKPGTRYSIAPGIHREQRVVPNDGDTFVGEPGAVLSGARALRSADFVQEGGHWWIGGQTQEGFVHGQSHTLAGRERDAYPEEVFVNGSQRLLHVASRAELASGRWFFDYAADKIWLADDPASFELVETSTAPFAFGGTGVRDVTLQNLVVEKYASPFQFGAIGGDQYNRYTYGWTVLDTVARYNHGVGIMAGPGMTVDRAYVHDNGQLGMGGNGMHPETGYTDRVVVRNSEIAFNRQLGVKWGWEGGGTKFSLMRGMEFSNNWVHHNKGPGAWFDVDNRAVEVFSNLVEDNENQGIFYEISNGARIYWNIVRRNSTAVSGGGAGAAIDVSNSGDTEVFENLVYDSPNGINVRHDNDRVSDGAARNVYVHHNDVQMDSPKSGLLVVNTPDVEEIKKRSGNVFRDNLFRIDDPNDLLFTWGDQSNDRLVASEWLNIHGDRVIQDAQAGSLPLQADAFDSRVGPSPQTSSVAEEGSAVDEGSQDEAADNAGSTEDGSADQSQQTQRRSAPPTGDSTPPSSSQEIVSAGPTSTANGSDILTGKTCAGGNGPLSAGRVIRVGGLDRIETAVQAAQAVCPDGQAPAVVLSRSDDFPDSQTGTPLAVHLGAPLLLTPTAGLHPATEAEIQRVLNPGGTVHLLGSYAALSEEVEQRLHSLGYATIRYNGANRFHTAAIVAKHGLNNPSTVLIADGGTFANALIAGVAATAYRDELGNVTAAVLLTAGDEPAAETTAYLEQRGDGAVTVAIGSAAATAYGGAEVVTGSTDFETSVKAARRFFPEAAVAGIARADDFPDALTGGAVIGRPELGAGPMLLTDSKELPSTIEQWLSESVDSMERTVLFGGVAAISENVESQIKAIAAS